MDSDYHLFDPKQEKDSEKDGKNKKDHTPAYFKFVNQFRNHLKKIENNYSGEDVTKLANHFNFINKYENEFEEQRENCINCYNALKEQISVIEKTIPNFDVNIFNTFFQTFEEYYSFFEKSLEVLKTFSEFNDETQELYYICKRKNYYIDELKDFFDKISIEYADKNEEYDYLKEKFKNLTESYDKLYKIYQESKSSDLEQYENIENKELMIQKLNEKNQDLTIENDRVKKKYFECSKDLEAFKMAIKFNYVLKSESENKINEYKFKIQKYETDNINMKQIIKNLKADNEKLIQEKEFLEEEINSNLNKLRLETISDKSNYATLIEENEEKEEDKEEKEQKNENENKELDNSLEEFQTANDLGDLLMDCEENETEEEQKPPIENGQIKEDINISSKNEENKENKDNQDNNNINNDNNKDAILEIGEDKNEIKNKTKSVNFNIKKSLQESIHKKSILKGRLRHAGSVKIRYQKKPSVNINSAYDIMFSGKQFQFPSRVVTKKNFDYFKQFFFLLYQSMKMNSDKVEVFLESDPETLYNKCRSEHTPYHKYQSWLEKQLWKKEQIENGKKYEDFATITGIFCSSLI